MTLPVKGSRRGGFAGFFGRRKEQKTVEPVARLQLDGAQIARLFYRSASVRAPRKSGGLHLSEIHDRNEMTALRGALYSGK